MKILASGTIRKNLFLLVLLAVVPALALILYTGMEQRQQSIEEAKRDLLNLTDIMAEAQKDFTTSTKQILSTLSLLSEVQSLNSPACSKIFRSVIERNPDYFNITLSDLDGNVLAAGRPYTPTNIGDRKHFQEAVAGKAFAVGEYIISRVGITVPAFAFAYPVLDRNNRAIAVLAMAIKLEHFSRFYDFESLLEKSFVAVTDHKGIRLFYYPPNEETNPIGKPIRQTSWEIAIKAEKPGAFFSEGSDGARRLFAFNPVRLGSNDPPYMYVWTAVPEAAILSTANAVLLRNVLIMLLITMSVLFVSWIIGKETFITPISHLVAMTRKFAEGNFWVVKEQPGNMPEEIGALTKAFYDMAYTVTMSQNTLRENEARFRLVMNSMDALVYAADMNTYEVVFLNEYGKRLLGDISGKICWQSIQQGQHGPCPFCTNKYLLDGDGKPHNQYIWEFQNTATGRWFHIQDRAIQWVDGRIVRLEIATDITDRIMMEMKLAEERELLTVTLRSIDDGIMAMDLEGRVLLMNHKAETMTGWNTPEAFGRPLSEICSVVFRETRQSCDSLVDGVLQSGEIMPVPSPVVLISRSGAEIAVAGSCAPIKDKDRKTIGVVLVIRDITEQLRMEQEVIKIKKLESIGVLAGGIAHDFNNILAAILGNIDLARLDPHLSVRTGRLLEEATKASFRARDLTQQLLTFARGGEPIKETASLAEVVKDSADFILRGQNVSCSYSFPEDLWLVSIDKSQISQVVQNIILNACHAMPNGGVIRLACENVHTAVPVNMHLPKGSNYVKMRIEDSGVGIPANVLDKIFDPYFSTKQLGSGLGLAITHSIVTRHGGHIDVQSIPGIGTTFTVYLPASEQQSLVSDGRHQETGVSAQKGKIMVMDDEELVRNVTQAMLQEMGHEVVCAERGEEAIRLYQEAMESGTPFDLIIMDLTIAGGMGGKEAVKEILTLNPDAHVIVSSGYSNDPVMAEFRRYGFCGAIVKPFDIEALRNTLGQIPAFNRV